MAGCGYQTGLIFDAARSNWQNDGDRPIAWSAWYPTEASETGVDLPASFFDLGAIVPRAALSGELKFPVVLLSHGTGGTAESLGWLGRYLARRGFVVLGANHHGNTGTEPYCAEGFLCWWERATDLSLLVSSLATTEPFADRLNLDQVFAAGFSLGAYTVLAMAGAQTSLAEFEAWQREAGLTVAGPKEFPDAADHIPKLLRSSRAFQRSWAEHDRDVSDNRVRAIVAIAPPSPVRSFKAGSLARLTLPVTLLTGGADREAPAHHCAGWLRAQNNEFKHYDLGRDVGHYSFLEHPSDKSLIDKIDIFTDHVSLDRRRVHEATAKRVVDGFFLSA